MTLYQNPVFKSIPDRPFAHCATITVMPDGALMTAWMGGTYETAPDVTLLSARKGDSDLPWSQPRVIENVEGRSMGQPVLFNHSEADLWFFYDVIMEDDWTSAQPYWQRSRDGGQTWREQKQMLNYPGLMFRSKPLEFQGRVIVPVYDENTWQSRMFITDDGGVTWRLTDPLSTPQGNIHPTVVLLDDGRLLAYLRTGGKGGVIWRTESTDGGDTWNPPEPTDLPNPNSGIDLARLHSGNLLLAYNPSDHLRTPLCVALAGQDENWRWQQTLNDDHVELSYPHMAQTADGEIHLVYTYARRHIHYACFSEDWLREGRPLK